jgi:hypothetical protein
LPQPKRKPRDNRIMNFFIAMYNATGGKMLFAKIRAGGILAYD